MRLMTEKNLKDAFAGESQAHMKYLIFAEGAKKEDLPNVARLFRAIAFAEQVHATNHLRELGDIKKTVENLQKGIDGETYEALEFFFKAVTKAGTDDVDSVIKAWEGLEYDGLEGKFVMRACDHQAVYPMYFGATKKTPQYDFVIASDIKTLTGEEVLPTCEEIAKARKK